MEFDKSRVYTALNADELQIGSKCIFANGIKEIKDCLQTRFFNIETLTKIKDEAYCARFIIHNHSLHQDMDYALAYLIELPTEPKPKPFENLKQLIVATEKHGKTVKSIAGQNESTIIGMTLSNRVIIDKSFSQSFGQPYGGKVSCTTEELLDNFVFLSDNSPCGELVEE